MDQLSILCLKSSREMNKQGENNLILMQIFALRDEFMSTKPDYWLMVICIP